MKVIKIEILVAVLSLVFIILLLLTIKAYNKTTNHQNIIKYEDEYFEPEQINRNIVSKELLENNHIEKQHNNVEQLLEVDLAEEQHNDVIENEFAKIKQNDVKLKEENNEISLITQPLNSKTVKKDIDIEKIKENIRIKKRFTEEQQNYLADIKSKKTSIIYVPKHILNREFCLEVIKINSNSISFIPQEYIDTQMYVASFAGKYKINPEQLHNLELEDYQIITSIQQYQAEIKFEIDLHGLSVKEANERLNGFINRLPINTNRLIIIHGYNNGTAIKNMLRNYKHKRIDFILSNLYNEGRTEMILKKPTH